jgi:[FeFe] hydrogenase H-cluster maturation GTPase HydF
MQDTPRGNRVRIGLFGRRNVGKSSVINALTNQSISLVSEIAGTTTDPVFKTMEILPLGPCVLIDTAGIDDVGVLGNQRVERTLDVIRKTDIGLIVFDAAQTDWSFEQELIAAFDTKQKPYLLVRNKVDACDAKIDPPFDSSRILDVSAKDKTGINHLKEAIGRSLHLEEGAHPLVADLIRPKDLVVLVTPIDSAAPKGRIILPQQQVLRDVLDAGAIGIVTKETELSQTLESLSTRPALVVTDSQAFELVSALVPSDIPLTSFSILYARNKGDLDELVAGARAIDDLPDGATILVSEACTHHRQEDDIGTVKIPRWLQERTNKTFRYVYTSGYRFPSLDDVDLVIHCGACMLNRTEMMHRIHEVTDHDIPIVNYGVLISYVHGIFDRALAPVRSRA